MAAWIPLAIKVGGSLLAASGARKAGKAQNVAAKYEAKQLASQANEAVAASQREAMEQRREANLVGSRALALAAASGGGASDPSVMKLLADLKGEGAYRSSVALYQGEERARQLRMGAAASRFSGQQAQAAGRLRATSYLLKAGGAVASRKLQSTMYEKYGQGGPEFSETEQSRL